VKAGVVAIVLSALALTPQLGGKARPTAAAHAQAAVRAAAAPAANLWVDASGGSCARSQTASAYRDSAACSSIDSAWAACRPGDVVVLKAGVYGAQTVAGDKASPGCTFKGENGTTIGDLRTSGRYFTLENVTVDVGTAKQAGWKDTASNVTLKNVAFHGPFISVDISGASNVSWLGGELGSPGQTGGKRVCGQDAEPVQVANADHVTIDGVTFHPQDTDLTPSNCSTNGFHLEMVRLDAGTTFFTLSNSTFESGDHSDTASIFITEPGGGEDPHDLTFQNNFFGTNDAVVGVFDVHSNVTSCVNFTFAYNTFLAPLGALQCRTAVNTNWIANLGANGPAASCLGTWINNVWQDSGQGNCGNDKWVSGSRGRIDRLGLGGPGGFDLMAGSPAIDAGDRSYCTGKLGGRDHDGRPRPIGARCDAGAEERCTLDDIIGRRVCAQLDQLSDVRRSGSS
jgi:hypothetical protein